MLFFSIKINRLAGYLKVRSNFKLSPFSGDKRGCYRNIYKYFMGLIGCHLLLNPMVCYSRDFGVVNNLFPVTEVHFGREMSQRAARLTPEQRAKIEQGMQKKAKEIAHRPKGNKLPRATRYRRRIFDSSVRAADHIVDHKGNVIHPKGTRADPFHNQYGASAFLTRDWLFFDGDDPKQVEWARQLSGGLVLINGSPVEVSQELDAHVFFDQLQAFSKRLNLTVVPARLSQAGMGHELIIEEFVV